MASVRLITASFLLLIAASMPMRGQERSVLSDDFKISLTLPAVPSPPPLWVEDTVVIRCIGDVMLHTGQIDWSRKAAPDGEFEFGPYFERLRQDLEDADLSVANMEFTLAGEPYTGYPAFSAPDAYADYVASMGVDVFLTANNHILDKGLRGADRTLRRYRDMSSSGSYRRLEYTGSGLDSADFAAVNPLFIPVRGMLVAIVNFTYGTNMRQSEGYPRILRQSDTTYIRDALHAARDRGADLIVAMPHWGVEYVHTHNRQQEALARFLAAEGADVIVGAHPHFVQDMQVLDGGVSVYYSLGNAVSNMSAKETQVELMLTLRLVRHKDGTTELLTPEHSWLWCSRPGQFKDGYCVLKIDETTSDRSLWQDPSACDRMLSEYDKVRLETGI